MNSVPAASIPQSGEAFPDFSLPAALPDGTQNTFSLKNFAGNPLILFFYPKDATSGCTIEVCGFRDEYSGFQELGARVLGVSRDKVSSHQRFIENQRLPYPLLADAGQTLIHACNLLIHTTMYGKPVTKVLRTTFALDENGVVLRVWDNVSPVGHAREVLDFLRERAA
jgi:peroxiredoxin Q/BCP